MGGCEQAIIPRGGCEPPLPFAVCLKVRMGVGTFCFEQLLLLHRVDLVSNHWSRCMIFKTYVASSF